MTSPPPDFVIIGAMKAATSTLHDQLSGVPGLAMSNPKEPCFFSDDDVFARGEDWYEGCFSEAAPGDLRGESSTHYTKLPTLPDACERLHRHRPDARLVYVIRHPVDRLVSHYIHGWTEGWYTRGIEEAIAEDSTLIDYGRYAMQLEPWLERFGPRQLHLVPYDGIRTRPQVEFERVAEFLKVPSEVAWDDAAGPRNASASRLRSSWFNRWFVYPRWATIVRRALVPKSVRNRVRTGQQMTTRPELSDATSRRLESIFDRDLARLSEWLGRDIRCRNFAEATTGEPLGWSESVQQVAAAALPEPRG